MSCFLVLFFRVCSLKFCVSIFTLKKQLSSSPVFSNFKRKMPSPVRQGILKLSQTFSFLLFSVFFRFLFLFFLFHTFFPFLGEYLRYYVFPPSVKAYAESLPFVFNRPVPWNSPVSYFFIPIELYQFSVEGDAYTFYLCGHTGRASLVGCWWGT